MASTTGGPATSVRHPRAATAEPDFLAGGDEMGTLIREHDWAQSRIGAPQTWSPSLKMMVSVLLANRFPLLLWWGADYISIYNDAYRLVLGAKHPHALGLPCRECWSEIWHVLQPLIDSPFQGGPATWMEDLALEVRRHGFTEESHFTVAVSPVPDETAPRGIGGVLATVHEITGKVIGERRIATLRELGARSAEAKSAEQACLAAAEILAQSPKDVPFALIYLLEEEGKAARLVAAAGLPESEAVAPSHVPLTAGTGWGCPWPLAEAVRAEAIVTTEDLTARLPRVPPGPWSDPPQCAVVIPLRSNAAHQLAGLLVAGVSSRLRLNDLYRSFFELVAAQIATAIASARAYEEERKRAEALADRVEATAGARILLADDNADMRAYLRDLLSQAYAVEAVADGEEALAAARRARPDLVLSDVMMPRLDGIELLRALRADRTLRDVPVILVSARAGEEARVEALAAGADDYLVKPFSARELAARVGARLELVRMRRETEQALREREEQLRLATEAAEVGLWDVDLITDTLFWPPRVKAMFGISPDAFVSMADFYSGLHPADRERTSEAFAAACDPQRRALYDVEYRTVGKEDGAIRWVAAKGRGIFDAGDRCVRVIGTAIDITARKRIEAALDEANRRKDEFLAMLAHELRNPLAPIGNASELLARIVIDDTRAQTAIQMIKRQVTQLTRLVDDLLDVSRITQGRIELRREPVELATVIAQAVETVSALMRGKRHELTVVSSYEALCVNGDLIRLVQCVGNLLANAAKYTDPGGKIRVQTRAEESAAVIEVADNGAGIAPELLPRVFDLFVQSERTLDRAQGGLGIGLSVVKRLTEMHGGQVTAESPGVGLGSSFEIRLPRIAHPQKRRQANRVQAPPQRILIVDDNADSANSLALLLTLGGHMTRVALTSEEALGCAEAFEPQVALLDIGLPRMNGYELARRLRSARKPKALRLIALTGYGQAEDRERALAAGFDDHLVKPVDLQALERVLGAMSGAP